MWDVKCTSNGVYVNDMDRFKVIVLRSLKENSGVDNFYGKFWELIWKLLEVFGFSYVIWGLLLGIS